MNHKKEILFSIITRVLITLVGLITNKIIAITVGGHGIAILSQLKSFVLLFMQFGIVGSNNLIIKLFARKYEQKSIIYSTIFISSLGLNLLFVFIFSIYYDKISFFLTSSNLYTQAIMYFLISVPSITLISLSIAIASAKRSQKDYALFILLPSLVFMLLIIFSKNIDINVLINFFTISFVSSSIMICFYLSNSLLPTKLKISFKSVKMVLTYGIALIIPFFINNMLMIYLRHLMLSVDTDYTGYWQSVFQVNDNIISIIYIYIMTVLLPIALKYKNPFDSFEYIRGKYLLPVTLYIILSLLFFIFKEEILMILYSEEFILAQEFVVYQIVGDFFKMLSWMFSLVIISYGLIKIIIMVELLNFISSIILIDFLIETYGIIGGSYAYLLRSLVYFLLISFVFYLYKNNKESNNG